MDSVAALRQIAFQLELQHEPTYRVRAFRRAAATIGRIGADELEDHVRAGTLTSLPGIGKATAGVVTEAMSGAEPKYLTDVLARGKGKIPDGGALAAALRGDCHTHSDWSDGGSPIREMAETARDLGREWMVLTDHSPRLTVANGLSADRLRVQLDVIAELNEELAPFRILTGIEVDIHLDGTLDQDPELLSRLDIVVASVHSKLRMSSSDMTRRMLAAVADPHVTVLGHCTGRLLGPKKRPESTFDAERVFEACRENRVAVEINSRPERLDPPLRLLRKAARMGCTFSIDSDAHAPGQLGWLPYGCERALECDIDPEDVLTTKTADELLAWKES